MSGELTIEEILEFPELKDVREELADPRFLTRTHGAKATSYKGCDGPLCRKKERDAQRELNRRVAEREGREYRPYKRRYDRDELLDAITEWHKAQREAIRKGKVA